MSNLTWITGAGTGIGEALARRLAADGHMVFASGRRLEPLAELARKQAGITPLAVDVTDRAAIAKAVSGMGEIHTAILCAGTHAPTPARSFDAGDDVVAKTDLFVECAGPRQHFAGDQIHQQHDDGRGAHVHRKSCIALTGDKWKQRLMRVRHGDFKCLANLRPMFDA